MCEFTYYIYMVLWIISMCREEIQRIKASNPDISHREAFSTAAKNVSYIYALHY